MKKGFTLLEMMIIVALVAILAGLTIPGLLAARRTSNATNAMGNLRSFASAMATYSENQADQSYPPNMDISKLYYSHLDPKGGYKYYYFSNTRYFVYYAFPHSLSNGIKIYFVDERSHIYEANCSKLNELVIPTVDFNALGEKRITQPVLEWKKKN